MEESARKCMKGHRGNGRMGQWLSNMVPETDFTPSTPTNTRLALDPRSPTVEIDRTPIEVKSTPQSKKADNGADKKYETTPTIVRERPRTMHQKLIEEKRKKMENESQAPSSSS